MPRRCGAITSGSGRRDEADALPLGSGAIAGTNYAIDTAGWRALGFSRVVTNSIDARRIAISPRRSSYACSLSMVHLSRLAEDLIIFSGEEHGFFELSDALAPAAA